VTAGRGAPEVATADSDDAGRDVDAVLRRLPVLETYAMNIFRLTGVATDATPAAIRRRREEVGMAVRLGTRLANPYAELAPVPEPDPDTLKAAFEAMQSPVTRLVHEALWITGRGGSHDEGVGAHCRALEAEAAGRGAASAELWRTALAAWARTLADSEFVGALRIRAKELDDPRVTPATVTALLRRLPRLVLAPSAVLAVAAAGDGEHPPDSAVLDRHLVLLREAPFGEAAVSEALRQACEPVVTAVHDGCAALLRIAAEEPSDVPSAARELLVALEPRLGVPAAVLPADDPLPPALHDEVAGALTRAAVAHANAGGGSAAALAVLARARDLARDPPTAELVRRTAREISDAAVLTVVEPWCTAGDPDGALEVLRMWRRREPDPARRADIQRLAADPRAVRAVMAVAPNRAQYIGCGVRPFGHRARAQDTWVETRCLTLFWAPVYPLAAYLSDEQFVYAKVPMSNWTRIVRLALPVALVLAIVLAVLGVWAALAVAAATVAVLRAAAVVRHRAINAWLDQPLDPAGEPQ